MSTRKGTTVSHLNAIAIVDFTGPRWMCSLLPPERFKDVKIGFRVISSCVAAGGVVDGITDRSSRLRRKDPSRFDTRECVFGMRALFKREDSIEVVGSGG